MTIIDKVFQGPKVQEINHDLSMIIFQDPTASINLCCYGALTSNIESKVRDFINNKAAL